MEMLRLGANFCTVSSFDRGVDQMQINTRLLPGKQETVSPETSLKNKQTNKMACFLAKTPGMSSQCPAQLWLQPTMAEKDHRVTRTRGGRRGQSGNTHLSRSTQSLSVWPTRYAYVLWTMAVVCGFPFSERVSFLIAIICHLLCWRRVSVSEQWQPSWLSTRQLSQDLTCWEPGHHIL